MILGKIISAILIGFLLSIGLWVVCYILIKQMYPRYSLQIRHHLFSLLVAIITFILYCSLSAVSTTISGIEYASDSAKEIITKKNDIVDNYIPDDLSIKEKSKQVAGDVIDTTGKEYIKKLNITWWGLLIGIIIIQFIYFGTMIYKAEKKTKLQKNINYEYGRKSPPNRIGRYRR